MRLGMMYLKGKDYEDYGVIAPLSFGYLSAYLEHYIKFNDVVLEVDNREGLLRQSPDIIGLSSFTETFEDVIHHARHIKQMDKRFPLILGGEHISALPLSLPREIDIGVLGEGEQTLAELMHLYERNEATPDNLRNVKGIVFWDKGERIVTAPRPWIEDMDSIPMPNRELLLKDTRWQQPIFTARGCPYKCTFCASTRFWQKTRYHSVKRVVDEIEYIVREFPRQTMIPINDDLFPLNKQRMRAIVDEIRKRKLHQKVGFSLNARASIFDEEVARMIVEMNGQVVCFGLESASDKILDALKGKTSASDNQRALEICEQYSLPVVSNMMVGTPEETEEDLAKSWWFVQKNQHRFARPAIAFSTPFPGTGFWQEAKDQGLIGDDFERWNILDIDYHPGQSLYMNKFIPESEFAPLYTRFLSFQAPLKESYKNIYNWVNKRKYFESLYHQLLENYALSGDILDISFEAHSLADVSDHTVTKAYVDYGEVNLNGLESEQYDWIILSHVLEKLKSPAAFLQQLKGLLKPTGQLLVFCYNAQHPYFVQELLRGKLKPTPLGIYHHYGIKFFSMGSLQQLLGETGFTQTSSEAVVAANDIGKTLQGALDLLQENLAAEWSETLSFLVGAEPAASSGANAATAVAEKGELREHMV